MRLTCPFCGLRDHAEFSHGGDAAPNRPAHDDANVETWVDYVYYRNNPRGRIREYWQHIGGCRRWLIVERNTLTHDVTDVSFASSEKTRVDEDSL